MNGPSSMSRTLALMSRNRFCTSGLILPLISTGAVLAKRPRRSTSAVVSSCGGQSGDRAADFGQVGRVVRLDEEVGEVDVAALQRDLADGDGGTGVWSAVDDGLGASATLSSLCLVFCVALFADSAGLLASPDAAASPFSADSAAARCSALVMMSCTFSRPVG